MLNKLYNVIFNRHRYATHPNAVVISCYYNPKNSPARLDAFNKFYKTIKHMNHRIIECVVGDVQPQLPNSKYITRIKTPSNLWHKEQLLNIIIRSLPSKFKYVLWVDADVIFTNENWITEAVSQLKEKKVVQLFSHCHHLDKGETEPDPKWHGQKSHSHQVYANRRWWNSYAFNYVMSHVFLSDRAIHESQIYEIRGHVGFAWGARRDVLEKVPLYDRALIGGADGIIAYASTGQLRRIDNITDMFSDSLQDVYEWGDKWYEEVKGSLGYVSGDLYHIWHGDIANRQYYKRIKEFGSMGKEIKERDENGLYIATDKKASAYVDKYFDKREVLPQDDGDEDSISDSAVDLFSDIIDALQEMSSIDSDDAKPNDTSTNHHHNHHNHHSHHVHQDGVIAGVIHSVESNSHHHHIDGQNTGQESYS